MPQNDAELVFSMDKEYELKNDGSDITLDVIVGDKGQTPDLTVKLGSKKILPNHDQSVKNQLIGVDTDLAGRVLKIIGNVADTAEDTNKIEVTVKVKGGVSTLSKKFSVTVEDDGEEVDLFFTIRF